MPDQTWAAAKAKKSADFNKAEDERITLKTSLVRPR